MALNAGDSLGPYIVVAPIGEGGMGEVYKARDPRLDRVVAIKTSKTEFTERFEREARAVAALNHPNICQIYDVGPNYLVMEFIEGRPLAGPMAVDKALAVAGQILDALDAAHKKGIVHRDLKPANILATKQGIKLLDFGLAKQAVLGPGGDATVTAALTQAGEIAGTLQYMSPEQLHGGDIDGRSDLFAFGCVLYELLSGKRAFEGRSAASVIAAVLEREPEALELHPPLDRVIRRALAKDVEDRWQTARDLKAALDLAGLPVAGPAVQPSRRWMFGAMGAAGVAGVAGVGWFQERRREPSAAGGVVRYGIPVPEPGAAVRALTISPDERMLAIVTMKGGLDHLWVHRFATGHSERVNSVEYARYPFWSPDGRQLAYFADEKLWRVDVGGGRPVAICESGIGFGGAWHPNGSIIFSPAPSGGDTLLRVPVSGGKPIVLNKGPRSIAFPQFVPGTEQFFYLKPGVGTFLASLDAPEGKQVLANPGYAAYSEPGALLYESGGTLRAARIAGGTQVQIDDSVGTYLSYRFVAASTGIIAHARAGASPLRRLLWMGRDGKSPSEFGRPMERTRIRLSPDGHRLAYSAGQQEAREIWVTDLDRQSESRLTFQAGTKNRPAWSPDGKQIAYSVWKKGQWHIYRKAADGSGEEILVAGGDAGHGAVTDWSGDGKYLLTEKGESPELWLIPLQGEGKPYPLPNGGPREADGVFSPLENGKIRWVAYQSWETGRAEIFVRPFSGTNKGKWQISMGGGNSPRWRADGRELYYFASNGSLMAVSVAVGESFVAGKPEMLPVKSDSLGGGVSGDYDVAPDGKRFLVNRFVDDDQSEPITVTMNWRGLLEER